MNVGDCRVCGGCTSTHHRGASPRCKCKRDRTLEIRVTKEQKRRLVAEAIRRGVTLSALVRDVLVTEARKELAKLRRGRRG